FARDRDRVELTIRKDPYSVAVGVPCFLAGDIADEENVAGAIHRQMRELDELVLRPGAAVTNLIFCSCHGRELPTSVEPNAATNITHVPKKASEKCHITVGIHHRTHPIHLNAGLEAHEREARIWSR